MHRWNIARYCGTENAKVDAFIDELVEVCERHGLMVSSPHGWPLIVYHKDEDGMDAVRNAHDGTEE